MVTKSIAFVIVLPGLVYPPANTARVGDAAPPFEVAPTTKFPKSVASPVDAIVINCMTSWLAFPARDPPAINPLTLFDAPA